MPKSSYLSFLSRRWRMLVVLLCSLAALAIIAAGPSVSASLPSAVHSKVMDMPYEEVYADGTVRQITAPDAPANPPRQPLVDPTPDPYLEPGFPLYTNPTGGTYMAGPSINALVGNIDSDPTLEILATGLATGPLYAWNSDGSLEPGWPVPDLDGAAYPALGELSVSTQGLEVFSGDIGMWPANGRLFAYTGGGLRMPGWPQDSANYVPEPASLIDVNSDGLDEIFLGEEDMKVHAYLADGSILPGWPVFDWMHGQRRNTPTLADLDGDGQPDIVTAAGAITPGGVSIFAYHADATPVAGWPVQLSESVEGSTFPMMGDVDGDGSLEMVVMTSVNYVAELRVYAADGTLKRSWPVLLGADNLVPTPVLADLDGDRIPEIIYQAAGSAFAWRGDGTPFPGWPVQWSESEWVTNGLPVVGDVDGDGQPDVVMESSVYNSSVLGYLRIYNRFGVPLPGFPREIDLGAGGVPAIADIDGDGRNEVIVRGTAWDGGYTWYPSIWAFDLHGTGPYGRIEWGQFSEDPEHHGVYQPRTCTSTSCLLRGAYPRCTTDVACHQRPEQNAS